MMRLLHSLLFAIVSNLVDLQVLPGFQQWRENNQKPDRFWKPIRFKSSTTKETKFTQIHQFSKNIIYLETYKKKLIHRSIIKETKFPHLKSVVDKTSFIWKYATKKSSWVHLSNPCEGSGLPTLAFDIAQAARFSHWHCLPYCWEI